MALRFTKADGARPGPAVPADAGGGAARNDGKPLVRRAASVCVPALVSLLAASIYLAAAPRTYTGATALRVETAGGRDGATPAEDPGGSAALDRQVRRITSDAVLRQTVLAEQLADDPEFASVRSGQGGGLLRLIEFGQQAASVQDRVAQATVALASHLAVGTAGDSPVVDVRVSSRDPAMAARLSDAVAQAYLQHVETVRSRLAGQDARSRDATDAALLASLDAAKRKLSDLQRERDRAAGDALPGDGQALTDGSARLAQAVAHVADLKARLDEIRRARAAGLAADALPDIATSPLLDKLRERLTDLGRQQATLRQTLGDRHPAMIAADEQVRDVRRLIGTELNRIQVGTEADYRSAQADVGALQGRVATLKRVAAPSSADPQDLASLQHDVNDRQAAYDRFRAARPARGDAPADEEAGRIIAFSAVPTTASSPRIAVVLAGSLVAGLAFGVLLMAVAERMAVANRRVPDAVGGASSDFLEAGRPFPAVRPEASAVHVRGTVPSPFGNPATLIARDGLYDRLRTAWPTAIEAEHVPTLPAFRTAIHALMLDELVPAHPDGAPRTVLVTSLDGADGRTAFALGLAESAAGQGQRAIVIDADEQGSAMRELVLPSARPILIDLMGTSRICYRVASPLRGSLNIVPIMTGEATIVRRLSLQGAAARIDGLAANFDLIVFDGPRVGGGSRLDAMAATVDAVIVTALKSTAVETVAAAIEDLDLPRGTQVSVVRLADLADGATTSVAA